MIPRVAVVFVVDTVVFSDVIVAVTLNVIFVIIVVVVID